MKLFQITLFLATLFISTLLGQDSQQRVLQVADSVYKANDIQQAVQLYEKALAMDSTYEALWKYGRTLVDQANLINDNDDKKEEIYRSSVKYAKMAIASNPNDAEGYFVLSMCVGKVALMTGGKEKVELSKSVKENALKAIELNPKHDGALHVLARWHREVANLSWILKGLAKIIYGGLPDASNEEAVKYFLLAIKVKPNHINHHFELAKTYEEMGEDGKAIQEFQKCLELPSVAADDPQLKKEAKEHLDDLM